MSRTARTRLLGVVALIAGVLFFWLERRILPGDARPPAPQKNIDLVESVVRIIRGNYVDEPDASKTMRGAFQGMVNSLDAMSSFLDKAEVGKLADPGRSRYNDLGLILFKRASNFPLVVGLIEGSPAQKAGIRAGDVVSALDDRSTALMGLPEIRLFSKSQGTKPVKVRIVHENATKEIMVPRGPIYPRSFTFTEQNGTAGILAVHHFYAPLVEDVRRELLPRLAGKPGALVLDLRGAFEGENEEARRFLNLFLKTAQAGSFEMKDGAKEILACPDAAPLETRPVVLWVDQTTMGPAEIVAACLRESRKVKAVGVLTPGLTARQDVYPLAGGDAILLTTGVFATASGEKVWAKGITPDIKLEFDKQDRKIFLDKTLGLLAR
jgi:carboxyl-terminal processing protease